MRGKSQAQPDFLTVINLNDCVPTDPQLRAVKCHLDGVLQRLSPLLEALNEELGAEPMRRDFPGSGISRTVTDH